MIDFSPVLPELKKWAPTIATVLGGPAEAVAVTLLCIAFGATPATLVDAMLDANKRNVLENRLKNLVVTH